MKDETMDRFVIGAFFVLWCGAVALLAYQAGRTAAGDEASDAKQCWACSQTQACPFGPGIVGVQHCEIGQKWSKCEPDPKYKVSLEEAVKP